MMEWNAALTQLAAARQALMEASLAHPERKMCVYCGLPVRTSQQQYEVFERMHYLCFHLNFEHGDTDPDQDCGVTGCQWDRTSFGKD